MALTLRYAARSDVGLLREGNEDSVYAGPRLLAVADGMGGHAAGEVASSVTIATIAQLDEDTPPADLLEALRSTVDTANAHLKDMVAGDPALEGMGTTLTALLWAGARLGLVHIGDSRAYLLRGGELEQITHDHTLVQSLVDEGRITPDEADTHPQRSLITRALDGRSEVELDLSVRDAREGDRYLICSDGLSGVVSDATLAEALREGEPAAAVDRLIDLALRGGGPDNITCIVADVVDDSSHPDVAPVVDGAAAAHRSRASAPADHAAGRAALASRSADEHAARHGGEPDLDGEDGERRGWRRGVLLTALTVVVVGLLALGGFAYVSAQYYVGASADEVAIFRGVSGSVAGIDLHSVHSRPGIPLSGLPPFEREQVQKGIPADNLTDAHRIVERLRTELPCPTPSPARSAAPAPTLTPATTPRPVTSVAPAPSAAPSASPSPSCGATP